MNEWVKLISENFLQPKSGPPMHTHFLQEECIKVVGGRMGYHVQGQEVKYVTAGEIVFIKRGYLIVSGTTELIYYRRLDTFNQPIY